MQGVRIKEDRIRAVGCPAQPDAQGGWSE